MPTSQTYSSDTSLHGWRLLEPLGEGASAKVWRARDHADKPVAVKILTTRSEAKKIRFEREIDALVKVAGTGSLPILDYVRPSESDLPGSYSMPIATPLKDYVRQHRPGIVGKIIAFKELALALMECHTRGVAHCDVKPDNIFNLDGRWVLGDFGLSMKPGQTPATEPNEFLGTRHYVAPELGKIPYRYIFNWSKCDSYSFAITLWETLLERRCRLSDIESAFEREGDQTSAVMDRNLYRLLSLAKAAAHPEPKQRLSMTVIHGALERWLNDYRATA
jgi:serine/threonine protein kinase